MSTRHEAYLKHRTAKREQEQAENNVLEVVRRAHLEPYTDLNTSDTIRALWKADEKEQTAWATYNNTP